MSGPFKYLYSFRCEGYPVIQTTDCGAVLCCGALSVHSSPNPYGASHLAGQNDRDDGEQERAAAAVRIEYRPPSRTSWRKIRSGRTCSSHYLKILP